jgi:myo-inositol 2-dehydrogenase/D-chiro-inositol 1-dehydrogenase
LPPRSGLKSATRPLRCATRQSPAVVIATSTDTHAALIQAAARAGKAIFCEKPLDLDAGRATETLTVVTETGALLALGFNRRYDPSFRRLRDEIAAGRSRPRRSRQHHQPRSRATAGRLYRPLGRIVSRHDDPRPRHGAVVAGRRAGPRLRARQRADRCRHRAEGDIDTAVVVLETADGRLCQITNSRRCAYGYDQRIEVFGSLGMVRAGNQTATSVEVAGPSGFGTEPALPFFLERYAAAYRAEIDEFVRAVKGERADCVTGTMACRRWCWPMPRRSRCRPDKRCRSRCR